MLIVFLLFASASAEALQRAKFTIRNPHQSSHYLNNRDFYDDFDPDIAMHEVFGLLQAVTYCIEDFDETGNCCLPSNHLNKIHDMTKGPCDAGYTHLSQWDVSEMTNMAGIFNNKQSFNQPLQDWDVSSATDMQKMFMSAKQFNQPIGNWDVSKVTDMSNMFKNAFKFDQPIGNWDVSNVTSATNMFDFSGFDQTLCGKWLDWSSEMINNGYTRDEIFGDETTCAYACPNGTPLDGSANEVGEIKCESCIDGFVKREDLSCSAAQCTCPHGTLGVGAAYGCLNDGDVACSQCDCGFKLDGHACIADQNFLQQMLQNVQDTTLLENRYKELKECESE